MVLGNTIGQKVNFFTGSNMSEFLDAEKIAISAGATNVLFSTRLVESDFQGFDEDYCHIDVHEASNATMNELEKQSGIFIQPRDAVIQKISVQEETIRFSSTAITSGLIQRTLVSCSNLTKDTFMSLR